MRFELRQLHKRIGITTLYVTHDQDEALVLADRIVVLNQGRIEQVGTPQEIYRRPASRFVASFIGTANLLEGTVAGVDVRNGLVAVALDAGDTVQAAAPAKWLASAYTGQRATVLVRPEDAVFERPEDAGSEHDVGHGIEVDLLSASYLGNRYELHVQAGGIPLRVQARTIDAFNGGKARLWFRPDATWVAA